MCESTYTLKTNASVGEYKDLGRCHAQIYKSRESRGFRPSRCENSSKIRIGKVCLCAVHAKTMATNSAAKAVYVIVDEHVTKGVDVGGGVTQTPYNGNTRATQYDTEYAAQAEILRRVRIQYRKAKYKLDLAEEKLAKLKEASV